MKNNLLYIGLNGYAGSGKDTVAKMLKTILNKDWNSLEECKEYYKSVYTNPTISATYNQYNENDRVFCIAFADQLKYICSSIFGIPVKRFYQNKSTAWVCINKDFKYTEVHPDDNLIVTAEQYYDSISEYKESKHSYWMSLREVLVYVGTYVLQQDINKSIFVNIIRNTIKEQQRENNNLKYVIVTDIRFNHEIDYIQENSGITISITRNDVQQLDNIAEHDLDEEDRWNYIIENNGTYDDLFEKIWNLVHENVEFENITYDLVTRENVNNYIRLIDRNDEQNVYRLCSQYDVQKLYRSDGSIYMIDPVGGPAIELHESIPIDNLYIITVHNIEFDEDLNSFIIYQNKI